MKKSLFFLLLTFGFLIKSQTNQITQRTCSTPILPQQFESWVQSLMPLTPIKNGGQNNVQSIFYIPVIVHVIHNNEAINSLVATSGGNLSSAQIQNQITTLNKDYNATNTDTTLIPAIFKPLLGKFQVNFCLAVVNPTGGILAEPGIDRINRVSKGWTAPPFSTNYIDATIKPNSIWNPNYYLNIWVSSISGGVLGYATFPNPGTSGLAGLTGSFGSLTSDGVVILNTAFGSIGTAAIGQYNKGRTLTHEVGHWIGLRHVWGDSNCGSDFCSDTPPSQTSNFGCPNFPYHVGTCAGNSTGEMTMNYMDYTDDACMYMFSKDQKNRAQLILTNSPMRASLITSTVCNLPSIGNDVGITSVSSPTYSQTLFCANYINPIITVTNYGTNNLTSALFTFNVNAVNTQTMFWSGNISPNSSATLAITQISALTNGNNVFNISVSLPNGGTDNNMSNNSNQQQFNVINTLSLSVNSPSICYGSSAILNASGASNYTWSSGPNTSSIVLSPTVTSTYTLIGSSSSCISSVTTSIYVYPIFISSITSSITTCESSCDGIAKAIASGGTLPYSYTILPIGQSPAINSNLCAGNYTFIVKDAKDCKSNTSFTISAGNFVLTIATSGTNMSCAACNNGTVMANGINGIAPYTYTWMPGNVNGPTLNNIAEGCYTVTVEDNIGCLNSDEICLIFDTGIINQSAETNFTQFFPNPNNGLFTIDFSSLENKQIQITNVLGQVIKTLNTKSTFINIDLIDFLSGIYYVKITTKNKTSIVKVLKN